MINKKVHVFGGGTVSHVRNHLGICAPAYGETARSICYILESTREDLQEIPAKLDTVLHLTKMAGGKNMETNEDVATKVAEVVADPHTKIIFFNVAMCDFDGQIGDVPSGKYAERLHSRDVEESSIQLKSKVKIVGSIRKARKDIFLVAFKTTCGATPKDMYLSGLNLVKEASVNLVLVNDTKTRMNLIVTPEEAHYHGTTNREEALRGLVEMTLLRSHLTFTRSTVVAGVPVSWNSEEVPAALRTVVDYCIGGGAYKPFRGATVGHFAAKISDTEFLTSIRKTNFNDLNKNGLVRIKTDGPDSVIAYGAKPSVGGQSQRIVFHEHRDYDCIVHFHCPMKSKTKDDIPVVSQREFECGSHQCGQNTSSGLKKFGNLSCVFLDQHGPNIVFNRSIDPKEVIDFINANFDLDEKTGGLVS